VYVCVFTNVRTCARWSIGWRFVAGVCPGEVHVDDLNSTCIWSGVQNKPKYAHPCIKLHATVC
jgi:hypothetical protein